MLRTKIYMVDEPLLYDAIKSDISEATLIEIQYSDEKGNLLQQDHVEEGEVISSEVLKYSDDNKLLSIEFFTSPGKELFRKSVLEYTENGDLKKTSICFHGQLTSEETNFYNLDNKLVKTILKRDEHPPLETRYDLHRTFPGCCVREEIFEDGRIKEIITREWELVDRKPFCVQQSVEKPGAPEPSRTMRFYDGRKTENGVSWELYNELGDFLEEVRNEYDAKERITRITYHTDDHAASSPYHEELFEYDEKDHQIFHKITTHGKIQHVEKSFYHKDRLVKKLEQGISTARAFFFVHDTAPGN